VNQQILMNNFVHIFMYPETRGSAYSTSITGDTTDGTKKQHTVRSSKHGPWKEYYQNFQISSVYWLYCKPSTAYCRDSRCIFDQPS